MLRIDGSVVNRLYAVLSILKPIFHKKRDANMKLPNANYIPPLCIGGRIGLTRTPVGHTGTRVGYARLLSATQFPRVGCSNAKTQHK